MKDIDNIENWYRDELNKYNVEPDKNVWDSLSDDLDTNSPLTEDNISKWYKKEVSKLEERPDYTVWEKLSTQLDTASVWDKLSVSLNRYNQLIWWRNIAIRGTAIFLLFFTSYLTYNNYTNYNEQIAENKNTLENNKTEKYRSQPSTNQANKNTTAYGYAYRSITEDKSINETNKGSDKINEGNSREKSTEDAILNDSENNQLTTKKKATLSVKNVQKAINPSKFNKSSISKENTSYASLEKIQQFYTYIYIDKLDELKNETERTINTDIDHQVLTERNISHMYANREYLVKKNNDKIVFNSKRFSSYSMFGIYTRRIYVGFNISAKKQGMITTLKENSALSQYKQKILLDFGSNIGGTVGLIVSDNLNMEANISLYSSSGYKRAFNGEGVSYQENLNLNYSSVSLLAKKMNNKSTFDNKVYSTNFIGGIYASYLRTAVSDINGVSQKLDNYSKTDFGIVLGIEQDRYITKTLVITPGIRYNQGITNNASNSSPFKTSTNFSFELNLGLKYILLKKGK